MTQVLIAVDDSDSSLKAARSAHTLFGDAATYTVVNVAEHQTPVMWGGDTLMWGVGYPVVVAPTGDVAVGANRLTPGTGEGAGDVDNAPIDDAIRVARDVASDAAIPNPQVVGEVGDPATAILDAARHHSADVIVIGSHERNWFSRLFSPSVSGAVMREAEIPVLVIR
ncbi:MAG TPA: universal stress protein [Ilumatobacteraceae bacterium]